jgi:raffinose/stachyose/melibiose transport system permease protein
MASPSSSKALPVAPSRVFVHLTLIAYLLLALLPILLVFMNSFKSRDAIFNDPLAWPTPETFSLIGYTKVLGRSDVLMYFGNSFIVTIASLFFILLFGAMAAWGLSEYRFKGNRWLKFFFAFGIMVPIRLGTVSILQLMWS